MAWRLDRRAATTPAPEPLRLPGPLNQLPWDLAKDQFGIEGADFIGVLSALILRVVKDEIRSYPADSKPVTNTYSDAREKTRPELTDTGHDAVGVSSTQPAIGASASARAAPPAPAAGVAG